MKILTIVQARMTSSRLPGKVMRPILGAPMMGRQIERLRRSERLGQLVVATSLDASDDVIVDYCAALKCPTHRGPLITSYV
jgi:spore coat polysaccharide biosynthesis protein SpsF